MPKITSIVIRRGTTTNWSSVNPVLSDGEITWDSTVSKFKIGDGSNTWMALPYVGDAVLAGKITAFTDPNTDRIVFWDDSAKAFGALAVSNGLNISGTTLTADISSETTVGIVELATASEVAAGVDNTKAIHPAGLSAQKGVANGLASLDSMGIIPAVQLPAAQIGTSLMGTYAQRPPASSTAAGTIYYATNVMESYRSNGSAWNVIAAGSELGSAELRTTLKLNSPNGSWMDLPGMAVTFVMGERPIRVELTLDFCVTMANSYAQARIMVNDSVSMTEVSAWLTTAYKWDTRTAKVRWTGLVPGNIHTIKTQVRADTGSQIWIDGSLSKTSLLTVSGV